MAEIPEPIHSITALIDQHHQTRQTPPRPRMGISTLGQMPIFLDDKPNAGVLEMRSLCRRLMAESGKDCFAVRALPVRIVVISPIGAVPD